MKDTLGFCKIKRKTAGFRPIPERIKDYLEVDLLPTIEHSEEQALRCMDCGTPFCHFGCPLGNYIPEWNELISRKQWFKAYQLLSSTNNLPEITGRLCPGLCEFSCTLDINDESVTIRENELSIIEYAFKNDYISFKNSVRYKRKKIAIIGSGPAGLSCADELNKLGYKVIVFERENKYGGILRYGVPNFKLEKWVLDRRLEILKKQGIEFLCGIEVGKDITLKKIQKEFDAIVLAAGCEVPRDLNIEGRELKGIYFALDYLNQINKISMCEKILQTDLIVAKNKNVVIIGGGDTGSDCVGSANRQGAKKIIQLEILPKPSTTRPFDTPWPKYPVVLKTTTSHQEGVERYWQVLTKKFIGDKNRNVKKLLCSKVEVTKDVHGIIKIKEIPYTEFEIEADLVIIALGFIHTKHNNLIKELNLELDEKGNVKTDKNYMTKVKGIFSTGDMHRGQSLIVWAIKEARDTAYWVDKYLAKIR